MVPTASTIKLFVASAFWRSGLDDCALLMLAFSDNAATNVLLDRLGFDAVNAEAAQLGCTRTEVRRKMMLLARRVAGRGRRGGRACHRWRQRSLVRGGACR